MTLNTEIPLWGIITITLTVAAFGLVPLIKMWSDQRKQKEQIQELKEEQHQIRELIEEKHDKVLAEVKKLEANQASQSQTLVKIETLLNLIIQNKIRNES